MSKFHFLIFFPFLYLQHNLVAIGFEFAAVQHSPHEIQLPHCHEDEAAALLEFRSSLDISQACMVNGFKSVERKLEQWKIKDNCCTWYGIECDIRDGHIIGLDLSPGCLSGSINITSSVLRFGSINSTSSVFRLLHLQKLNLAYIDFNYSEIPSAIGNFSRLTSLNLSFCGFAGPIPSQLLNLTNLTYLDLSRNYDLKITQVPNLESLTRSLTKLEELHLSGVNISSPLPHVVTNLTSLKVLDISYCSLTGELPSSIFNLPKLQVFDVSGNLDLSGYFPEFQPGSLLEHLLLKGVSISGGLPNSLGNLTYLIELSVSSSQLGGFIPSSIVNLTKLTYLNLPASKINGPLPSSFGYLTQLVGLDLSANQLTGQIPSSFRNLINLRNLYLGSNQLIGPIRSSFGDLINLEYLDLHSNQLTGEVPSQISKLTNLTWLDLSDNKLQGTVQLDMFLGLKLLYALSISSNNLSVITKSSAMSNHSIYLQRLGLGSCKLREFPKLILQNQENLEFLDLSDNELHGVVPTWFFNMSLGYLFFLNLSRNLLTSFPQNPVPFKWENLDTLDLSFNALHGSIPLPPESITSYDVSNNHFSGEIASLICNLSHPNFIDFSNNNFTGDLPQCIANLTSNLHILSLHDNNFVGKIPEMEGSCEGLRMIDLSNNQLVGPLPRSLSSCFMLEFLNLGNNMLSDSFPSWLGSLDALTVLILRSNKLHGVIHDGEVGVEFPLLQILDLSHNFFEGHLPSKLFQFWNSTRTPHGYLGTTEFVNSTTYFYYYTMTLMNKGSKLEYPKIFDLFQVIDLSSNDFSGQIPTSIADLRGLQLLNLSNNHLVGTIPPYLGSLTELQALDLSKNSISGGIPQQLVQLTFLEYFNVSDNNLSGSIPQGNQFNTFGVDSYERNEGLCGDPLSRDCGNNLEPPPPPPGEDEQESEMPVYIEWKAVVVGYLSAFIVTSVYSLRAFYMLYLIERAKRCLDFSATLFIIHLVLCILCGGWPSSITWWIVNGTGLAVMVLLGEYLCNRRELQEIPITRYHRANV